MLLSILLLNYGCMIQIGDLFDIDLCIIWIYIEISQTQYWIKQAGFPYLNHSDSLWAEWIFVIISPYTAGKTLREVSWGQ